MHQSRGGAMTLREYMYMRGLTIRAMADLLRSHPNYIGRVVRGEVKPSERLAYFAQTVTEGKVSAEKLLGYQVNF